MIAVGSASAGMARVLRSRSSGSGCCLAAGLPSVRHEGALMLVRDRPQLLLELLARATDYVPPAGVDIEVDSADFTQAIPARR